MQQPADLPVPGAHWGHSLRWRLSRTSSPDEPPTMPQALGRLLGPHVSHTFRLPSRDSLLQPRRQGLASQQSSKETWSQGSSSARGRGPYLLPQLPSPTQLALHGASQSLQQPCLPFSGPHQDQLLPLAQVQLGEVPRDLSPILCHFLLLLSTL